MAIPWCERDDKQVPISLILAIPSIMKTEFAECATKGPFIPLNRVESEWSALKRLRVSSRITVSCITERVFPGDAERVGSYVIPFIKQSACSHKRNDALSQHEVARSGIALSANRNSSTFAPYVNWLIESDAL